MVVVVTRDKQVKIGILYGQLIITSFGKQTTAAVVWLERGRVLKLGVRTRVWTIVLSKFDYLTVLQ